MRSPSRPPGVEPPPSRRGSGDVALQGVFRWIGAHVRGFHSAVGLFLTLGLTLVLLAGALFALLARLVVHEATQPTDEAILLWLDAQRAGWLDKVMQEITALGSGTVILIMVMITSIFLWLTRHRYSAALLWIAVLGGFLLNYLLKEVYERTRPDFFDWATHASHLSFPSGHAMNGVIAYGTMAYLVSRLEPDHRLRRFTWLVAVAIILLVGFSRPYLGVHYPTDVIAGWIIGFTWAAICALGIEALRYFRGRKPEVELQERDLDRPALGGR